MENSLIHELLEKLGIKPNKISYYIEALTHSSYANDHHLPYNYEKLEFIGDAVISLSTSDFLNSVNPNAKVGNLSKLRTIIVQSHSEITVAKALKLNHYFLIGNSFHINKNLDKIYEDVYEALIGAIYFDQGFDIAKQVVINTLCTDKNIKSALNFSTDYKSLFQELTKKYNKNTIKYLTTKLNDNAFTTKLYLDGICYGTGKGKKIKIAEQDAAKAAIKKLTEDIIPTTIK